MTGWAVRTATAPVLTAAPATKSRPGRIRGYAITFDQLSVDLGGFRERIRPRAVARTLRDGLDVRALIDHDVSKILGRQSAGTLRLHADHRGLLAEIDPPDTQPGRDILVSVGRGDVRGMSFAFRALEDEWRMEHGEPVRDVLDMEIREVSIVSFPAYPSTSVSVTRHTAAREAEWWRKLRRLELAR
jgi:HK97 family phage prohead protease